MDYLQQTSQKIVGDSKGYVEQANVILRTPSMQVLPTEERPGALAWYPTGRPNPTDPNHIDYIFYFDGNDFIWKPFGGGGGDIVTLESVGVGNSLVPNTSSFPILQLKSIAPVSGGNITMVDSGSDITINFTGGGGTTQTLQGLGGGVTPIPPNPVPPYVPYSQEPLMIDTLNVLTNPPFTQATGAGITLSEGGDVITVGQNLVLNNGSTAPGPNAVNLVFGTPSTFFTTGLAAGNNIILTPAGGTSYTINLTEASLSSPSVGQNLVISGAPPGNYIVKGLVAGSNIALAASGANDIQISNTLPAPSFVYTFITPSAFTSVKGVPTFIKSTYVVQSVIPQPTTVAAASNNATLPTGTINVLSTAGFPSSGQLYITTITQVNYTGVSGNTFTGCTGGSGTLQTGFLVNGLTNASGINEDNINVVDNGVPLPTGTITVDSSTAVWPASGTINVYIQSLVNYAGITATSFTGCTGGTGTLHTADTVAFATSITGASIGQTLPQATISVTSVQGFPTSGTLTLNTGSGIDLVNYTGVNTVSNTFTGCTGGSTTMTANEPVTFYAFNPTYNDNISQSSQFISMLPNALLLASNYRMISADFETFKYNETSSVFFTTYSNTITVQNQMIMAKVLTWAEQNGVPIPEYPNHLLITATVPDPSGSPDALQNWKFSTLTGASPSQTTFGLFGLSGINNGRVNMQF